MVSQHAPILAAKSYEQAETPQGIEQQTLLKKFFFKPGSQLRYSNFSSKL